MTVAGSQTASSTRRSNEKNDEVVMSTNEAYETVAMRYQQPASALQRNTQEEPVYELPTAS